MSVTEIDQTINRYIANQEISGGSLIIRKDGQIIYKNKWGFADIDQRKPIEYDSIFRIMSMTKCVTAIGIMILVERGLLQLDDPLSKFIPTFHEVRVSCDPRYRFSDEMKMTDILPKLLFFKMSRVKTEPAIREISIRDLLSHSSGLEQGIVGLLAMMKDKSTRQSLAQQAEKYSSYVLDFQPGSGTGYSPLAGFDILARVIEIITGQNADDFFHQEIFAPLDMSSTTFKPVTAQTERIVSIYKRVNGKLKNVTGTSQDIDGALRRGKDYIAGSGGLYSTLDDYDHLADMLCRNGLYNGKKFLEPQTVKLIHTEAPLAHLEPDPGSVWGLSVKIRQDPSKGNSFATVGTYGWSGAFGTHFFVSPQDNMSCVWMVNRSDLNGAGSYISNKIEELVFDLFAD